jgi:acyl-CoA synthetase (AMP-forming)/AMP-acid ligase II
MIIRGGENIQPTEIEDFVKKLEGVEDCYVIGVPDKRLGEQVAIYVKPAENSNLTEENLLDFCKTGLARYKIPKYVKFSHEFPKTTTGKVQKFKLQKLALDDFPDLKLEVE